jgi:glycosyltransferase involved in cell wall biosynthesis
MASLSDFRRLRVGFVGSRSAFLDETTGVLWTEVGLARPLEFWAKNALSLTVALSTSTTRQPLHDRAVPLDRESFIPLPWMPSLAGGFFKIRRSQEAIREVERQSDVVIVQLPFEAPLALLSPQKPRLYHLIHDIWSVARFSPGYAGVKRLPAIVMGGAIDSLQRKLMHDGNSRSVANGFELYQHYGSPPGRAVVSATISESEILSARRQRPADAPFRVLFVGGFRFEKGIDTLVAAFEQLLELLPDAELEIIGTPHTADRGVTERLKGSLDLFERHGAVRMLGRREFGPDLFQCFADADVLALPSRAEGTPRVLIEARAMGCPVVATTVGGIPSSITHEVDGLLIPPDDPTALAGALRRLSQDPALRERLTAGGLERARRTTVEAFSTAIAEEAAALVTDAVRPAA